MVIALGLLCGCASRNAEAPLPQSPDQETILVQDLDITSGQTIYVPAYAEVYTTGSSRTLKLAVTLHIHNTDFDHEIIISSVRYFDGQGQLIKEYVSQPQSLGPMASTDFFVEANEESRGTGTNFIVEWVAEEAVYEPVVEAVMLSTAGSQGISFTSPGRVIRQLE